MLNKLQKLYTSSLARIDPKLSNIIGKMKLGSYDGITDKLFDIIHHKGAFYYGN